MKSELERGYPSFCCKDYALYFKLAKSVLLGIKGATYWTRVGK